VIDFAADLLGQIGLLGAALLIGIEVIIPPIPSEVVLLLTGFNVSLGKFGFFESILATTAGSLVGATFWYVIAHIYTLQRLENLVEKFGRYVGLPLKDLQRTMNWFTKHGASMVFFGRMLPIVRSLVSIPAGLIRMSVAKFYFFSAVGMVIWNTIWISIGITLGENWKTGEGFAAFLDWVIYALLIVLGVYVLTNFVREVRRKKD
jgi:membrane protein DedA with SNARE-associated domain